LNGEAKKERIIRGITKVFADEGIPGSAVSIVFQEVPKEIWWTESVSVLAY